jgi:transcriptional regulator with XRE-family HTH domain
MVICDRLRALREEKKLSQGDIEKRTGLLRCYIARGERPHGSHSGDIGEDGSGA